MPLAQSFSIRFSLVTPLFCWDTGWENCEVQETNVSGDNIREEFAEAPSVSLSPLFTFSNRDVDLGTNSDCERMSLWVSGILIDCRVLCFLLAPFGTELSLLSMRELSDALEFDCELAACRLARLPIPHWNKSPENHTFFLSNRRPKLRLGVHRPSMSYMPVTSAGWLVGRWPEQFNYYKRLPGYVHSFR